MRRRDVSPQELARVVTLRQANTTWLGIQRDTGIPRRIARKAYEQWERGQAWEELKAARQTVAAEEFRNHLYSLIKLAQLLTETLSVPKLPSERRSAEDILSNLWQSDIAGQYGAYGLPGAKVETQYIVQQNQALFKSLQTHTQEKVNWRAIGKWEDSWNRCTNALAKLEVETQEILQNILKQTPELSSRITKERGREDTVNRMLTGVLYAVWQLPSESDQGSFVQVESRGGGRKAVLFGKDNHDVSLVLTEDKLVKKVVEACEWAAKNLSQGDSVNTIDREIKTMRGNIEELRGMLNPLTLKPLIFSTRCDLCPA
jgi:hypothetical protein